VRSARAIGSQFHRTDADRTLIRRSPITADGKLRPRLIRSRFVKMSTSLGTLVNPCAVGGLDNEREDEKLCRPQSRSPVVLCVN
jgi:hypothetical protein